MHTLPSGNTAAQGARMAAGDGGVRILGQGPALRSGRNERLRAGALGWHQSPGSTEARAQAPRRTLTVGVPHLREEPALWRALRVVLGELQDRVEEAAFVERVWRAQDRDRPLEEVAAGPRDTSRSE